MLVFLFSHTATWGATSHLTYLIIMYGGIHHRERERGAQIGETLIILWKKESFMRGSCCFPFSLVHTEKHKHLTVIGCFSCMHNSRQFTLFKWPFHSACVRPGTSNGLLNLSHGIYTFNMKTQIFLSELNCLFIIKSWTARGVKVPHNTNVIYL